MLSELNVRSYGLIKELSWQPDKGLNIITGETGAGKSMVLDAFEALLDGRITEDEIKYGEDICKIEAVIDINDNNLKNNIKNLLDEKGLNTEDDSLLFSCDIKRHGRTVSRINGDLAQRSTLNEMHSLLVDIHGQSQHLSLYDKKNHLGYLDDYGHLEKQVKDLTDKFRVLIDIKNKITELKNLAKANRNSRDLLSFQIEEIEKADLSEEEETELKERKDILANSEKIKGYVYEIGQFLTESENQSAESTLGHALHSLRKLAELDSSLESVADELENATETISGIAYQISDYGDSLEFNPRELENIEDRLQIIRTMKRKYGPEIRDVLNYLEESHNKLDAIDNAELNIENLQTEYDKALDAYKEAAVNLSNKRKEIADVMKEAVGKELKDLEMLHTNFDILIQYQHDDNGIEIGNDIISYGEHGIDYVEFLVSQIPGEPLKPLAEIASTGEISRFTLAIKSALAASDKVPILIFDEIDIGVGGRTGETLGRKLWELSRYHQVICVTHLAQIACYGDAHFSVSKAYTDKSVDSHMERLNDQERLNELAIMLGGSSTQKSSLGVASELVKSAVLWKSEYLSSKS